MPEALAEVLAILGAMSIAAAAVQYLLTPIMGARTSNNARMLGLKRESEKWTPARAERVSRIGALWFLGLGAALLVASGVVWLVSAP